MSITRVYSLLCHADYTSLGVTSSSWLVRRTFNWENTSWSPVLRGVGHVSLSSCCPTSRSYMAQYITTWLSTVVNICVRLAIGRCWTLHREVWMVFAWRDLPGSKMYSALTTCLDTGVSMGLRKLTDCGYIR